MRADKVNTLVRDKVEAPCVTLADINLTVGPLVFKRCFLPAPFQGRFIYINADNVPVQKLRFYKRRSTAGKLVENKISLFIFYSPLKVLINWIIYFEASLTGGLSFTL